MIVQSRRQLLQQALVLPFALPLPALKCRIISGPDYLSQESAEGYLGLMDREQFSQSSLDNSNVIVVAGTCLSRARLLEVRSNVRRGALLIWENHAFCGNEESLFQETFEFRFGEPLGSPNEMYVRYRWPSSAMVRKFGRVLPVECQPGESIAHFGGKPIAMRKRMGRGCLIFLGSMLGPHLRAGDREAQKLARGLILDAPRFFA